MMMERLRSGAEEMAAPLGQPFWPTGIIPPNLGSLRIGGDSENRESSAIDRFNTRRFSINRTVRTSRSRGSLTETNPMG